MVIVVALVFVVSWSPFYLINLISQVSSPSFLKESNFVFTMMVTHLLGFLNSCINPFIYSRMSEKFRRSFRQVLLSGFCCLCKRVGMSKPRYRSSLDWPVCAPKSSSDPRSPKALQLKHDKPFYSLDAYRSRSSSTSNKGKMRCHTAVAHCKNTHPTNPHTLWNIIH